MHGWPETWYAWRLLMPALARDFEVIAVDQRGIGLTDKPEGGYDSATLADDLVALMEALGHERFAVVGHDTGFIISYALAADHPQRVARVALAEIPGPPMPDPFPPLFVPESLNNRLWHIPFNRVDDVPEQLVRGREDIFFGYEFAIQTGDGTKLPDDVVDYYVRLLSKRDALRGCFGLYREWDATLEAERRPAQARPLTMPVLAIGGAASWGEEVGKAMKPLANDVQSVVIPGTGHWVAETAPDGDARGADLVPGPLPQGSMMLSYPFSFLPDRSRHRGARSSEFLSRVAPVGGHSSAHARPGRRSHRHSRSEAVRARPSALASIHEPAEHGTS